MTCQDLEVVTGIEKESQPEPWSEKAFVEELSRSPQGAFVARIWSEGVGGSQGERPPEIRMVSSPPDWKVCGYVCFWVVADELQILNLAVDKAFRRGGVGTELLRYAFTAGISAGAKTGFLEVRKGNRAGREFYKRAGFREVGERPGYYGPCRETAVLMERDLGLGELQSTWPDRNGKMT
ncbi:MAG: GNAT family N-acetyltransferase [Deltaproteobacteria bacterium]|nr:GNAT family N-acetyltransferase [Deltaproteobacteria bacterium]